MKSKSIAIYFIAMAVASCHNRPVGNKIPVKPVNSNISLPHNKETPIPQKDTLKILPPAENNQSDSEYTAEDTDIITKRINYDLYTFHDVILREPFSEDSALIKLFPGQYYKLWRDDSDSVVFESWRSRATTRHTFNSFGDKDIFPLRDSNETRIGNAVFFGDSGKRSVFISFQTTFLMAGDDFVPMGRFDSPFLGLAMFTEENSCWRLKAFNPAIGVYGMFQTVPDIHSFKFNKSNFACYLRDVIQGGGGPAFVDALFFEPVNKTFKIILHKEAIARQNRERNVWDSYMQVDSSQSDKQFPDLIFITDGDYLKSGFDTSFGMESPEEALPQIKRIASHKDNFDFTITSTYTYDGNKYKFLKENVATKKHKETKDGKNYHPAWFW